MKGAVCYIKQKIQAANNCVVVEDIGMGLAVANVAEVYRNQKQPVLHLQNVGEGLQNVDEESHDHEIIEDDFLKVEISWSFA
ncbi:hypothetical protein FF1_029091 [Malus domestica]